MKRAAFLAIIMLSVFLSAFSQKPECIFCGNNVLVETSSAIGDLNENFGAYSLTIGNNNKIAGNLQLVTLIGSNNIANGNLIGNYSGALGINNLIQSDKSYIIGNDDTVSATMAIAIGNRSKVSGQFSVAVGRDIKVSGLGSIGLGINSHVSGNFSAAIGNNAYANAMNSYSFGNNVWSDAYGSITIGTSPIFLKNTTPNSLVIGFNSSVPTLFVGSSDGSGTSGKVGIGNVTAPTAKLHIRADAADSATLRLEPGIGKVSRIYFSNTNDYYVQAANNQNMIFRTPSDKNFSFENGDVGIGTSDPQAKLHVNGDFQVGSVDYPQPVRLNGSVNSEALYAYSFGEGSTNDGNFSFVAGKNSHIYSTPEYPSPYRIIIGSWSSIESGPHSNVIGSFSQALNEFSFVFGTYAKAKGSYSFAVGSHVEAWSGGSFVIGEGMIDGKLINTIPNSLMIGFGSTLPTLFVEKAPNSSENNLTGRIGIGNITSPQAKLHIRADEEEDATLRLEATGSNKLSKMIFTDDHFISAKEDDHFRFNTSEDKTFSFHNGDIFIEDIDRGIIMKSPDGNCWRGTLDNTGSLHFVQVNCDDLQTGLEKPQAGNQPQVKIFPNPAGDKVFVSISPQLTGVMLRITDVSGKLLHTEKLTNPESCIDMTSYKSGMYVFSITGSNGDIIETMKVMKE